MVGFYFNLQGKKTFKATKITYITFGTEVNSKNNQTAKVISDLLFGDK